MVCGGLDSCQLDDFLDGCSQTVFVLTACLGEVGLTASTALHELGGLAYHLACVETVVLHHVVAHHHTQHGLVLILGADDAQQILGNGLTDLEHEVLGGGGLQTEHGLDDGDSATELGTLDEHVLGTLDGLGMELLNLFLHRVVLLHVFLDDTLQVLGIVEEAL